MCISSLSISAVTLLFKYNMFITVFTLQNFAKIVVKLLNQFLSHFLKFISESKLEEKNTDKDLDSALYRAFFKKKTSTFKHTS